MKTFLKKTIPAWIKLVIRKYTYAPKHSPFFNKSATDTFTEIYKTNFWHGKDSISGQGSGLKNTEVVIEALDKICTDFTIKTILDIPCGDFNWMRYANLKGIDYIGGDIVKELIEENEKKYGNQSSIQFKHLNLMEDNLPTVDLLFIRDCFVHFSYSDFHKAMRQICTSGSTYLMTTSFPNQPLNYDIITGDWRAINLQIKPYNFPTPLLVIDEQEPISQGKQTTGKSLILWKIEDLTFAQS